MPALVRSSSPLRQHLLSRVDQLFGDAIVVGIEVKHRSRPAIVVKWRGAQFICKARRAGELVLAGQWLYLTMHSQAAVRCTVVNRGHGLF